MCRKILILVIIQFLCMIYIPAQITIPGEPNSKIHALKQFSEIPEINMPSFDIQQLLDEDKQNEKYFNKPFRFAKAFEANINVKKDGLLEEIPNTGKIWRLRIKSAGAYSLNIIFGVYELPAKAELFIYNKDKTQVVGALTEINNNSSKVVPVQPIRGDVIIIEYFEPDAVSFPGNLVISGIGHDYKGISDILNGYDGRFGTSQWCNVDINCTEGDNWRNEKQSVCRILYNTSYYCTGSLINNVTNDGRAFVLTANHCINSVADANSAVFVFNYESPTCDGNDGSVAQNITNSTLRANWATSDFSFVELSSVPTADFQPYWNGWNNQNNTPTAPVVCIHHPVGDVKKISRDDDTPENNGNFWGVTDWTVGTVEHGSSGGPFYNSNHRVVGHVHGGNDIFCSEDETSEYGKFSSSWNGGGTDATRLRNWLDPSNTTTELPGLRLIQDATINTNTAASGDIVRFENVTVQGGSNVVIDINVSFVATGTFSVPVGATLNIHQ